MYPSQRCERQTVSRETSGYFDPLKLDNKLGWIFFPGIWGCLMPMLG
jgi:hypothetical protein